MSEILAKLSQIEKDFDEALQKGEKDLEIRFLGKKSDFSEISKSIKDLSKEEKPLVGAAVGKLRKKITDALSSSSGSSDSGEFFDVTEPVSRKKLGHLHPFTQVRREVSDVFSSMGFDVLEGDHVTTDYFNFTALNLPEGHPARDAWDTFYLKQKSKEGDQLLLRPHTSAMQVPYMQTHEPPLRTVVIGPCFRNEATDATHEHSFNQIEGFVVDENVSAENLVYILKNVISALMGTDEIEVRLRPAFFPFVEPGYEMDFRSTREEDVNMRKHEHDGWVELLGCGMIHPEVFKHAGYDYKKYTGFAFGMGFDRLVMMKYGIDDIRHFHSGDLRFVEQF